MKTTIGASDISGETCEFLEIQLKVQEAETLEYLEETPGLSVKKEPLEGESSPDEIAFIRSSGDHHPQQIPSKGHHGERARQK